MKNIEESSLADGEPGSSMHSSLPTSFLPTLSSYHIEPDRSTAPTTEQSDNGSATAIRSPSNPPSLIYSPLPSVQTRAESTQSDDDERPPSDKVYITFLLISGSRHTFAFEPSTTVLQVKAYVLEHWPEGWSDPMHSVGNLHLVYLGRFLENESTLESSRLRSGQATIVHLVYRPSHKLSQDTHSLESTPRCKCCIIL
ncbi:ubiquitin-related domain-containing protein [Spinellus fusiger]|nr:ubiquitin-related domain-containing protein [Spinellus fusiger]